MAKAAKKTPSKAPSKSSGKASAKDLMKSAVKAIANTLGKSGAKSKPESTKEATSAPKDPKLNKKKNAESVKPKAKTDSPAPKIDAKAKPVAAKKADKASSKAADKKAKKATRRDDEDEFLPEAIDGGEEELPDLQEFEEHEEIAEDDDLDDDDDLELGEQGNSTDDEVVLTDAEGRRYCKVKDCDQIGVVDNYCRYHYLLLWKKIQVRRKILADGKLAKYIEELTAKYPDKFLEMIRRDVKTEKDFSAAIAELEIDESSLDNEYEDEAQNYIDEVRGVSETSGMSDDEEF